jgi:hypothetical protein
MNIAITVRQCADGFDIAAVARTYDLTSWHQHTSRVHAHRPLVALAKNASSMRYNPVKLTDEALASALRSAI